MGGVEIPNWLKGLPLAPEFRPTDTEFADPIAYISKIEKEASAFGICKIIPPFPKPSRKYAIGNLNRSLSRSNFDLSVSNVCSSNKLSSGSADNVTEGDVRAVFTTRHQELGQSVRRTKGAVQSLHLGVQKQVWQSGENYTLEQFESKSKAFARNVLSKSGIKDPSPLAVESLFWKAASDKPIYVEYANDVPGSAFGEPEGKFRYFHRRRRKRNHYSRNKEESSELKTGDKTLLADLHSLDNEANSTKNDSNSCPEVLKSSTASDSLDDTSCCSRGRNVNSSIDVEGTAGWKLSNSPWNLQVIARSPGSLTRFMPDDIPGVTSPMVYIGMMFSWFAWHVEDHELHSMNFLHVGSQKTWYAVPGDYAFAFEDVIRTEAYGGSIDHLAALSLLGEKTTLLSPKTVIASGIPCCRLIQNPGEFVVTFPRAYHVGFSHGFNCGEAANFGTPQWLSVAKEAAVRRAAMNYLPMLSHQQLLYLLTMSFVSRVPRSLLPGVRSSRLRDRQKEERELLVKRGFVEDILKENNVLSILLKKESNCRAVLWNPDMLSYSTRDSQLLNTHSVAATPPRENDMCNRAGSLDGSDKNMPNALIAEMTLDLEKMNDLYLESDDLSCDLDVDSGTLACVACGVLGFPFMSVVQPSEKASKGLLSVDHLSKHKRLGSCGLDDNHCSPDYGGTRSEDSTSVSDVNGLSKNLSVAPSPDFDEGWNMCSKFIRPRSFCLEHAVEITELLRNEGGAHILVICHSDYHKIKANAVAIAEEIGINFIYNEVQLDIASEKDLRLIELAVYEERDERGEDWTSKLGINLQHCVKVRKNSPTKQVQHALKLDGLFLSRNPSFNFLTIKWLSKKYRSKKTNRHSLYKPFKSVLIKDKVVGQNPDSKITRKEEKVVQYYRRNKKSGNSTGVGSVSQSVSSGCSSDLGNLNSSRSNTPVVGIPDPSGIIETQQDSIVQEASGNTNSVVAPSPIAEIGNCVSKNIHLEGVSCNLSRDILEKTIMTTLDAGERIKKDVASSFISIVNESSEMHQGEELMACQNGPYETFIISEEQSQALTDGGACMNEANLTRAPGMHDSIHVESSEMEIDKVDVGVLKSEVGDGITRDNVDQECKFDNRMEDKEQDFCTFSPVKQQYCQDDSQHGHKEDGVEREMNSVCRSNESEPIIINVRTADSISTDMEESTSEVCKVVSESCSTVKSDDAVSNFNTFDFDGESRPLSDVVLQLNVQQPPENVESQEMNNIHAITLTTATHEPVSNFVTPGGSQPMHVDTTGLACANQNLTHRLTLENGVSSANLSGNEHDDKIVPIHDMPMRNPLNQIEESSGTKLEYCDASESCSLKTINEGEKRRNPKSNPSPNVEKQRRRKREEECMIESAFNSLDYIRSPCEGLRPRGKRNSSNISVADINVSGGQERPQRKKIRKPSEAVPSKVKPEASKGSHKCDLESCRMSFKTKAELALHKRNQCPHEGCGKRFSSHKYAVLHQRVHDDDRPLKCPWKGCSMSFKWAWARTEHIRVHTGERPYKCKVEGCGLSFRFVSDYSRHRRKTGHYVDQPV